MSYFPSWSKGGAVGLYSRHDVPAFDKNDSDYKHADFAGGNRRGYVKKTVAVADKAVKQTLLDVGLRKPLAPDGKINIAGGPNTLSAKGVVVDSGHRIQANVPLHLEFSGNLMVANTVANKVYHLFAWVITTIEGITPKIVEACYIGRIENPAAGSGLVHVPLKDLSTKTILSKDVDLSEEKDVKVDLYVSGQDGAMSPAEVTQIVDTTLGKKLIATGDAGALPAAFNIGGNWDLYFTNTVLDIWQPASGRDVAN